MVNLVLGAGSFTGFFAITLEPKTILEFKFKDVFPDNKFPCFLLSLGSWLEPELAVGSPSPPIH